MSDEIYKLFRRTLPEIRRNEETVMEILNDKENEIIRFKDNGRLAGVSVINANTIYLLCVEKAFQNRGIGRKLLQKSEEHMLSKGFEKAVIGVGKDYIMPGVPMISSEFFIKRGYTHSWGDCGCFDMSQNLADFDYCEHTVGDTFGGVTYRWASENDFNHVIKCVKDAEEKFVQYYLDKSMYNIGNDIIILVAEKDGEIAGTLHVCAETEGKGTGSVGCTTTTPKYQGRGIATNMVKLGTKYLKDINLTEARLGYTYTDIIGMYGRAGYKICMEYFMGEKNLK